MNNRNSLKKRRSVNDYRHIFDQTALVNITNATSFSNDSIQITKHYVLPNILVVGYYDRGNLGDDAFKNCFQKIGSMRFITSDDFNSVPDDIDVIICGGGDIINPYFMDRIQRVLSNFKGPVYAFSIGIPFTANFKYLTFFDHIILRTQQDIQEIEKIVHPDNITYMPDFTVLLKTNAVKRPFTGTPRIGFFLAQPAFVKTPEDRQLIQKITEVVRQVSDFAEVYLLAFNFGKNPSENDIVLNQQVLDLLDSKPNVHLVKDTYLRKPNTMMKFMSSLDLAFCMRFHSVMFSLIQNVPFVTMYTTRKIHNLIKDVDMQDYSYNLPLDDRYKPTDIDVNRAVSLVKFGLANPNGNYKFSNVDIDYLRFLLSIKKRKTITLFKNFDKTRDEVLDDVKGLVQNYLEIDDDTYQQFLLAEIHINSIIKDRNTVNLSRLICYGITEVINPPYIWGLSDNMINRKNFKLIEAIDWIYNDYKDLIIKQNEEGVVLPPLNIDKRVLIDLHYIKQEDAKGLHRSGWSYVMGGLYQLDKTINNKTNDAIIVDGYIDRTFHWGCEVLEYNKKIPYTQAWIGFLHHTFHTDYSEYNCDQMFKNPSFIASLPHCEAIIVMSNYLAEELRTYLNVYGFAYVPVKVLRHPTEIPEHKFSINEFLENEDKQVIQIGGWLRNSYAIYDLPVDPIWNNRLKLRKTVLKGREMDNYFKLDGLFEYLEGVLGLDIYNEDYSDQDFVKNCNREHTAISGDICPTSMCRVNKNTNKYIIGMVESLKLKDASVSIIDNLSNDRYDQLLASNIVFLNLVDCSTVNTVIECVVRNTPLIVNRHPAIEELLGKGYPGFYSCLIEASMISTDLEKIKEISTYLERLDKTDYLLSTFIDKFQDIVLEVTR